MKLGKYFTDKEDGIGFLVIAIIAFILLMGNIVFLGLIPFILHFFK